MTLFRSLLRAPGFTLTSVFTIAVATAVIASTFTLLYGIVWRHLPYPQPDRIVLVKNEYGASSGDFGSWSLSPPDFNDRQNARSFARAAAWRVNSVNLTSGDPERLQAARVTSGFFDLFATRRLSENEIAISDRLWRRRFGAAPDVVGRKILLDERPYVVATILPNTFALPARDVDVWMLMELTAADFANANRGNEDMWMLARLRDGVTIDQAQAEMNVITNVARESIPERKQFLIDSNWRIELQSLHDVIVGRYRSPLLFLFGAASLVLLLAAANVAGLFVARTVARSREISVRSALGAGRLRIARELASDVFAVAFVGAAIGVLLTGAALPLADRTGLPRVPELRVDAMVVTFTVLVVAFVATLIAALVAAAARPNVLSLRDRDTTWKGARARATLVSVQVAIAVTLVISGALLLESYRRLRATDLGFDPSEVLTFGLGLPRTTYDTSAKQRAFYEQVQTRLAALPGVTRVSMTTKLPLGPGGWTRTFNIEGREVPKGAEQPVANIRMVLPGYAEAMRIPVLRGRTHESRDRGDAPRYVVIDETAAKKWWPNGDPVGKRITFSDPGTDRLWREVIGVVGAVRDVSPGEPAEPHIYLPLLQSGASEMFVVVRGTGNLTSAVRAAVREIDPSQPLSGLRSMKEYVDAVTEQPRLRALLVAVFASIGVLLAIVGLYALLAYIVASRTREVGVRIALGATPMQVVQFVVRWSMRVSAAGIVCGVVGGFAMTRSMRALLYGVDPLDPVTYVLVAVAFVLLAATASAAPAARAARVDPAVTLRHE